MHCSCDPPLCLSTQRPHGFGELPHVLAEARTQRSPIAAQPACEMYARCANPRPKE